MTLALSPSHAGLLRAICEHPEEDTPRLVYADWLDEQPDTIHHACWYDRGGVQGVYNCPDCLIVASLRTRAEFIRVQCELAKLLDGPALLPVPTIARKERIDALRRRERELLNAHGRAWLEPVARLVEPSVKEWAGWSQNAVDAGNGKSLWFDWRRGFIAEVSCTVEDWCGQECPVCKHYPPGSNHSFCSGPCHGTGRVNVHGPALVQVTPIERVTLTDRRPAIEGHGECGWFRRVRNGTFSGEEAELPADVWKFLPGGFNRRDRQAGAGTWRDYPSGDAARDALSAAALTWARQQAGLLALS